MKIYKQIENIEFEYKSIITVGTFDGVHLGHRKVLNELIEKSKKDNLRAVVVTFDPHPQHIIQNLEKDKINLLTNIDERLELFNECGVPNVLVINFSKEFSKLSPEDFIYKILVSKVGVSKLLIGYDHLFGNNRSGNFQLLKELGLKYNFIAERLEVELKDELIISSSKIRKAISSSMIEYANSLLGYYYFVEGTIIHGFGLATKLGFPTANLGLIHPDKLLPANGVYLTRALINGKYYYGMANCGIRPTFNSEKKLNLEVHFFEYSSNLYGEKIKLEFLNFIRLEKKFKDADELTKQINKDREKSLELINLNKYIY